MSKKRILAIGLVGAICATAFYLYTMRLGCLKPRNEVSTEVLEYVNRLAGDGYMQCPNANILACEPRHWGDVLGLSSHATIEELTTLTDHRSANVRCYAFLALAWHSGVDVQPVLERHRSDSERVRVFNLSTVMGERVSDVMARLANEETADSFNAN